MQRVIIPLELKNKPFSALYDAIMATGDEHGMKLADEAKARIESASCTSCARSRAAASLRVWIARNQQENRP